MLPIKKPRQDLEVVVATRDEFLFNNYTFIHFVLCVNVLATYMSVHHMKA